MKTLKRCPDVELVEICGEYLLIATREARDVCPYVSQINESAAIFWKLLDKPRTVNELIECAVTLSGKEKKQLFFPVLAFVDKFCKSGHLIEEDKE